MRDERGQGCEELERAGEGARSTFGAAAVEVALALACEGVSLAALRAPLERAIERDGAGALAGVTRFAERSGLREAAPEALAVALASARLASARLGAEPPLACDQVAGAALSHEALAPELVAYLDALEPARRARWLLARPARAGGALLARALEWLEPAEVPAYVVWLSPLEVLPHLRGPRAAAWLAALLPQVLAWSDARQDDELDVELAAEAIAALGCAITPVLAERAASHALVARALALAPLRSHVVRALRDAGVTSLDERGLMPLSEARVALDEASGARRYAALLSLEDAAELVRAARRPGFSFEARHEGDLALVERYGEALLPWIESRIEGGVLRDGSRCAAPCLLAIARPRALELALRVVDGAGELALARAWVATQREGLASLAFLAAVGNPRASALLRREWADAAPAVRDAVEGALGAYGLEMLARRLGLVEARWPEAVESVLAEVTPVAIARGPVLTAGVLDVPEADALLGSEVGDATRVTAYASPLGDVLVIERATRTLWRARAFGPGAARPAVVERSGGDFEADATLRARLAVPAGAARLFAFDHVRRPPGPARASLDLVAICEALRTRRPIRRLPSGIRAGLGARRA